MLVIFEVGFEPETDILSRYLFKSFVQLRVFFLDFFEGVFQVLILCFEHVPLCRKHCNCAFDGALFYTVHLFPSFLAVFYLFLRKLGLSARSILK